jgi:hypothetical protein
MPGHQELVILGYLTPSTQYQEAEQIAASRWRTE